eukprot:5207013-Prymnesium_polylepis.1
MRSSHDSLLDGGSRGAGGALRSGGRHLQRKKVFWKNNDDFSYSRQGYVIVPYQAARDLGVRVSDFDWP